MPAIEAKKPTPYRTEKLTFASYLIAAGKAELVGTEPIGNGRNVLFVLSMEPSQNDLAGFFGGAATVSALRYSETMNTLKGMAHEARRCHG